MSSVVFLTFWGLSCTVLYKRTVVSQPGAWEVSTGFPTERSSCLSSYYGCRLFSQCVPSAVCVWESWVLLWGRSKNKQALQDSEVSVT